MATAKSISGTPVFQRAFAAPTVTGPKGDTK